MNLKTAFLLLWIAFLLSSCAGSGQYQTTRSHYTPNLAKEKLNAEVAWVAGVGASANAALKVSKHWGAVAAFQANYTSYTATEFLSSPKYYTKRGYSFDLGANFNTPIGEKGSFNVSSGFGYNISTQTSKFTSSYQNNTYLTDTNGAYWYVQPYLILGQNRKTKHLIACRLQNYGFNLTSYEYSGYYNGQKHISSLSLGYGIDYNVMPNLNFTTQLGLEFSLNNITVENGNTRSTNTANSTWAKIGVQFVLPSKK